MGINVKTRLVEEIIKAIWAFDGENVKSAKLLKTSITAEPGFIVGASWKQKQ